MLQTCRKLSRLPGLPRLPSVLALEEVVQDLGTSELVQEMMKNGREKVQSDGNEDEVEADMIRCPLHSAGQNCAVSLRGELHQHFLEMWKESDLEKQTHSILLRSGSMRFLSDLFASMVGNLHAIVYLSRGPWERG